MLLKIIIFKFLTSGASFSLCSGTKTKVDLLQMYCIVFREAQPWPSVQKLMMSAPALPALKLNEKLFQAQDECSVLNKNEEEEGGGGRGRRRRRRRKGEKGPC